MTNYQGMEIEILGPNREYPQARLDLVPVPGKVPGRMCSSVPRKTV
jgi:hypothetical protein